MLNFIYRRKYVDKSETTPFLTSAGSSLSPTAPIHSGTATINRTLLHHQQNHGLNGVAATATTARNGTTGTLRGLAISSSSDSPPPDYNIVVHDTDRHGFFISHTLF